MRCLRPTLLSLLLWLSSLSGAVAGLAVVPALNFSTVTVGSCSTVNLDIQHQVGSDPASGSVSVSPSSFSITGTNSFSVSGGSSATIQIRFCPTAAATVNGTATISTNTSVTTNPVQLTGTGIAATTGTGGIYVRARLNGNPINSNSISYTLSGPQSFSGNTVPADFQTRPAGSYTLTYNSGGPSSAVSISPSATQTLPGGDNILFELLFTTSSSQLNFNTSSIDFGSYASDSCSDTRTVAITASGGSVDINSVSVSSSQFRIMSGGGSGTLSNGQQRLIELRFCPTSSGNKSGTLTIGSSASGSPHSVNLVGVGASAQISVSPTTLDFGSHTSGTCSAITKSFTITASGGSVSGAVSISGTGFVLTSPATTFSLSNGLSAIMAVGFCPPSSLSGSASGTVTVTPNAGAETKTVALSGVGRRSVPEITALSADWLSASTSRITLSLYGTGFDRPTVILSWTGKESYVLPADQLISASSTKLDISIRTGTSADTWSVKVINFDGQHSNIRSFEVRAPEGTDRGRVIGSFQGVVAYSNGASSEFFDDYNSITDETTGVVTVTGSRWQCVEYVNRFYKSIFDLNTRIEGGGDNADKFFGTAATRRLTAHPNGGSVLPRIGDILAFGGPDGGHVAIVRHVSLSEPKGVWVIQQNFRRNEDDANFFYPLDDSNGVYSVDARSLGAGYFTQGWLRPREGTPQVGWWWNPSEPGRGFVIERRGSKVFVGFFLYDATGKSTWYNAMGTISGSTFTGSMVQYRNGQSLSGAYKPPDSPSSPGQLRIEFSGERYAIAYWPNGSTAIERFNIVANGSSLAPRGGEPEAGWWWNAGESGRGFALEVQNGTIFIAGFMYDGSGDPVWYLSTGPMLTPTTYQGIWKEYGNGQTLTGQLQAANIINDNVGPITVQFTSQSEAVITLPNLQQVTLRRFFVS